MGALETPIPPPLVGLIMGAVAWLASGASAPTGIAFPVRLTAAIGPEERALRQLFGADFSAYQSRVRRWL